MTVKQAQDKGLLSPGKISKYHNQRTTYDGVLYDSKKEANRAFELDMLKKRKVVKDWQRQVSFPITINGIKICTYRADFKVEYHNGLIEIEDVKGFLTDIYKLKKKLVKAVHGIDIREI